jgi:hypothetical protein
LLRECSLTAAGKDELGVRDGVRGQAEKAAMDLMGLSNEHMSEAERQATFGGEFGEGKWKVLCKKGTAVVMDYNIWHRGCRRMPGGLWRAMFKLQFFRATAPGPEPSWDHEASADAVAPFAQTGASQSQQETWTAMWRWLLGSSAAPSTLSTGTGSESHVATILSSPRCDATLPLSPS